MHLNSLKRAIKNIGKKYIISTSSVSLVHQEEMFLVDLKIKLPKHGNNTSKSIENKPFNKTKK